MQARGDLTTHLQTPLNFNFHKSPQSLEQLVLISQIPHFVGQAVLERAHLQQRSFSLTASSLQIAPSRWQLSSRMHVVLCSNPKLQFHKRQLRWIPVPESPHLALVVCFEIIKSQCIIALWHLRLGGSCRNGKRGGWAVIHCHTHSFAIPVVTLSLRLECRWELDANVNVDSELKTQSLALGVIVLL